MAVVESAKAVRGNFRLDQLQTQLIRGASTAFVINAAGTAAGFLAQVLLTRTLGADGYGIYAFVGAWVILLATLATLGFRTALLRLVPSYRVTEDWGHLRGVIVYAERRVGLAGAIVSLVGAVIVILRMEHLGQDLAHSLLIGLAIVPLAALINLRSATLRGFDRVATALAPDHVLRHVVVIVVVAIVVYGFGYQLTPASAVTVLLLATSVSLAMMTLSLRTARPVLYSGTQPLGSREDKRSWRRMASSMIVSVGAERLISEMPLLIIGTLLDPRAVALYAISSRCAGLISFGLMAFNVIFAPTVARLYALDRRHDMQRAVTFATWMMLGTSVAVALPMFVLAEYVLRLFGADFSQGANVLRILIVVHLIKAAAGQAGGLLKMTGHERYVACVLLFVAIASLGLTSLFAATMGILGAALSAVLIVLLWNGIFVVAAWRRLAVLPAVLGWAERNESRTIGD